MKSFLTSGRFWVLLGIITFGAFTRLIEHPPNFTPVLAIALFAGAYFGFRSLAMLVPIAVMLASDLVLHMTMGYEFFTLMRAVIYGTLIGVVCLGFWMRSGVNLWKFTFSTLGGAILFYLTTNFLAWAQGVHYPLTFEGLMTSYTAAIPFFRNTLASTVLYSALFFGVFELAKAHFPVLQPETGKATA